MRCKSFYFQIPNYPNFLTPKILKICDPIPVTLTKLQPNNNNPVMKMRRHPAAHIPYSSAYYQEVKTRLGTNPCK